MGELSGWPSSHPQLIILVIFYSYDKGLTLISAFQIKFTRTRQLRLRLPWRENGNPVSF